MSTASAAPLSNRSRWTDIASEGEIVASAGTKLHDGVLEVLSGTLNGASHDLHGTVSTTC